MQRPQTAKCNSVQFGGVFLAQHKVSNAKGFHTSSDKPWKALQWRHVPVLETAGQGGVQSRSKKVSFFRPAAPDSGIYSRKTKLERLPSIFRDFKFCERTD